MNTKPLSESKQFLTVLIKGAASRPEPTDLRGNPLSDFDKLYRSLMAETGGDPLDKRNYGVDYPGQHAVANSFSNRAYGTRNQRPARYVNSPVFQALRRKAYTPWNRWNLGMKDRQGNLIEQPYLQKNVPGNRQGEEWFYKPANNYERAQTTSASNHVQNIINDMAEVQADPNLAHPTRKRKFPYTHFVNTDEENPSWLSELLNTQQIGSHRFGNLADEFGFKGLPAVTN